MGVFFLLEFVFSVLNFREFSQLQKKHSKLLERCAKLEQIKNKFRDCTLAMQQRCDVVERDRESLRRDNESLMEGDLFTSILLGSVQYMELKLNWN